MALLTACSTEQDEPSEDPSRGGGRSSDASTPDSTGEDAGGSGDDTAAELRRVFDAAVDDGFSGVALVRQRGETLLRMAAGYASREASTPNETETPFVVGSLTKQFTGAAVLKLVESETLELDARLDMFFDAVPEDKASITLHQLLTHTAGFPPAIGDEAETIGREDYLQRAFATELHFDRVIEETSEGKLAWHDGGNGFFFAEMRRYLDADVQIVMLANEETDAALELPDALAKATLPRLARDEQRWEVRFEREQYFDRATDSIVETVDVEAGEEHVAGVFAGVEKGSVRCVVTDPDGETFLTLQVEAGQERERIFRVSETTGTWRVEMELQEATAEVYLGWAEVTYPNR